ncbi:MAG TPA: type II toxin-antitoxin system death-on-curing family toxin [Alphaproteobacteria bacterium]|nr:type II toxin-antitoxin system death-on-curing family toxin [Alphaproteobacteria bacterium]
MPSEPIWLPLEEIIKINAAEVAETGERHLIRDLGLLEGAQARPRTLFSYGVTDVVRLGVALLAGIARSHPFEQGNKRTALTACLVFIEANGYRWTMDDTEEVGVWIVQMVNREISEQALSDLMRPHFAPA